MSGTGKELKRGLPVEIVSEAAEILSALQAHYSTRGSCLDGAAVFRAFDDSGREYRLIIDFEVGRGDGEYLLVSAP